MWSCNFRTCPICKDLQARVSQLLRLSKFETKMVQNKTAPVGTQTCIEELIEIMYETITSLALTRRFFEALLCLVVADYDLKPRV